MTEKAEIIRLYKELGETPLECILRFKESHPEYREVKMTYLGRLDPMAEGLLLILAGNTRVREQYLVLDKGYEFEVLWGFESDTYDVLGLVNGPAKTPQKLERSMAKLLTAIQRKKTQAYPIFSSKSFGGDFLKARDMHVEEAGRIERSIRIFSITHIYTKIITGREMLREVEEKVGKVKGDFRQREIVSSWHNAMATKGNEVFLISKFTADVSSGTYIRSLADEMGKILKTSALAWSIKRTRVGEYKIEPEV